MRKAVFTYGMLDERLRALGFTAHTQKTKARIYRHEQTGARVILPDVHFDEEVLPHHLAVTRHVLKEHDLGDLVQAQIVVSPNFAALADEFEARVRNAKITGTTEVTLVYRCVDVEGNELPPVRTSLVPQTKIGGFGANGPTIASTVHRQTILGNINSLVRHAPHGLIMLRDAPQIPLRIVGFELQIKDVDAPAGRSEKPRQEPIRRAKSS